MKRIGAENAEYFAQLDALIVKLLKKTLEENSTSILVTNAHKSWVEYSAQSLLPETYKFIFTDEKIKVISARTDAQKYSA